ncbi:TPA: hypothetical protein EYP75_00525 [Candidatus Bathyarchaeota archaeon]|nr:hypothetical protein [Candidatus Bathyarchaeota archaeon]
MRVPPEYAYECIVNVLRKNLELNDEEIKHLGNLTLKTNLGGKIGVKLTIQIAREGEISLLNLRFNYRKIAVLVSSLFGAGIILSLFFNSPLPMLGAAVFLPIAYQVNLEVIRFLDVLNEILPFLEQEYARQILLKNRERWRRSRRDIEALYEKLRKKHIETWGNTNVLRYKIEEYQSIGLTYEEAIMKIAEEEGIITE